MVCHSLGRLGVRGPLWQQLGQRINERVDWLAPVDMALMLGRGSSRDLKRWNDEMMMK